MLIEIARNVAALTGSDGDVGEKGEILDKTNGASFGRFGRTDDAPLRVVELSRSRELSISREGRVATSKMRKGGRERQSIENL